MDTDRYTPSAAERRVLQALSTCDTVQAAAAHLGISVSTLNNHLAHLRQRTGQQNTTHLLLLAVRQRWVDL